MEVPMPRPAPTLALLLLLLGGTAPAQAQEAPVGPAAPGLTTDITRRANLEGRVLWMDATANLQRLSTREGISAVFDKCRKANVNTVVVDVKPLSGHVLFNSSFAPRLKEWRGFQYPEGHDLLLNAMLAGKQRGIRVYASLNIFSHAHKLVKAGPLYDKPEWQAIVYDVRRIVTAADGTELPLGVGMNRPPAPGEVTAYAPGSDGRRLGADEAAVLVVGDRVWAVIDGAVAEGGLVEAPAEGHLLVGRAAGANWLLEHVRAGESLTYHAQEVLQPILEAPSEVVGGFVNPAHPEVRKYLLDVVEEMVDRYAVDGVVFDRMRYSSLRTDFSPLSRELFEKWLGKPLERFPQDIYTYDPVPGRPIIRGPFFKQWLEWRAKIISDWQQEAAEAVRRRRPGAGVAAYVGSWYADYFDVGVNWGAPDFAPAYDWMTANYPATGYAARMNWLTTGCYYPVATREDARQLSLPEDRTVQAGAETSVAAVNDATFVYAGLQLLDYKGKPEDFRKAVQTALQFSQGVMLFDLVYLEEYDWWNILSEAFSQPRRAPHDVPGLQAAVQQAKKVLRPLVMPAAGGR
jgi:uncharacterized lipoprotein YddW (UPF0748 family)